MMKVSQFNNFDIRKLNLVKVVEQHSPVQFVQIMVRDSMIHRSVARKKEEKELTVAAEQD